MTQKKAPPSALHSNENESLHSAVQCAQTIPELANELTAESIPSDLVAPYRLISEMNEAPDGLFGRTLMIKSEVDE